MTLLAESALRFETFVVGAPNRLAVAAARAVAEAPGAAYNPLVIYGASGLGKTHLASAIAAQAQARQPGLRAQLLSAEEFVEGLSRAVARGDGEAFLAQAADVDVLVLDDVQFLTGQRETQSALLRLFNARSGAGRQLVLTSDRPPAEIADVDARLLSRLSGGLLVDVGAPDFEMRLAILRNSAAERQVTFEPGVLEAVARLPMGNVRELKGALNKLAAYQLLDGARVAAGDVRAILGGPWGAPERIVRIVPSAEAGPDGALPAEYDAFLADLTAELEERVDPWRLALGDAAAAWRAQGIVVDVLERALRLPAAPDVDGLLATFAAAVEHLRGLEAQAVRLDPSLRGAPAFRDPERVAEAQQLLDRALAAADPLPAPDPAFPRASLLVSACNQLAVAAADAVVAQPGALYNPLVLQGPAGTGKTHLLHAVGAALAAAGRTVACLSAPAFIDELIGALQAGTLERFRARYRAVDVFLLDDVQAVAGKERTQEELFHLFNALVARGAQVVLTTDRAPRAIHGLADRLRSRFEGGLVAPLEPPDRPLRQRLVEREVAAAGFAVSPAVIDHVAAIETGDVRELLGRVTRVVAAARARGVPLSLEVARGALGQPTPAAGAAAAPARPDATFRDREKVVWAWPRVADRLAEGGD